jgi:hypothetical protein
MGTPEFSGFFTKNHSREEILCLIVETIDRLMKSGKPFTVNIEVNDEADAEIQKPPNNV